MALVTYLFEAIQNGHVVDPNLNTKKIVNRFNFLTQSSLGVPSAANLAVIMKAALSTAWQAMLSSSYVDDNLTTRCLNDATLLPVVTSPGLGNGNVLLLNPEQADSAAYVKFQTSRRGKRGRGSKHFSPLDESQIVNGELTAGAITAFKNFLNLLVAQPAFTDLLGNTYYFSIMSQSESQVAINPTTLSAAPVLPAGGAPPGYVLDKTVGTMRHRRWKTKTA